MLRLQILIFCKMYGFCLREFILENEEHLINLDNSILLNGVNIFCIKDAQGNLYFDKIIKQ